MISNYRKITALFCLVVFILGLGAVSKKEIICVDENRSIEVESACLSDCGQSKSNDIDHRIRLKNNSDPCVDIDIDKTFLIKRPLKSNFQYTNLSFYHFGIADSEIGNRIGFKAIAGDKPFLDYHINLLESTVIRC